MELVALRQLRKRLHLNFLNKIVQKRKAIVFFNKFAQTIANQMNLQFNIEYQTIYGQELALNVKQTDKNNETKFSKFRMHTQDGLHWACDINHAYATGTQLDYYYSIERGDQQERCEWCVVTHRLSLTAIKGIDWRIYDHWHDIPDNAFLYTSAINECLVGTPLRPAKANAFARTIRLKVRAPQLRRDERLVLMGDGFALGNWHGDKAVTMSQHNTNEWLVDLNADQLDDNVLTFKFAVARKLDDYIIWEDGNNREITLPELTEGDIIVYELHEAHFQIPPIKGAGTLVPVFSLRSKESFGVGDFGDLKKMIDWVAQTRQRVLQLLPINDTTTTHTWTDSYPYSCISIFAIHPQYVDLTALPTLKDEAKAKEYEALRVELNALKQIDYERVNNAKISYLRDLYVQEGKALMDKKAFKTFFKETEQWLVPYAQYCTLRDEYGTGNFTEWPDHNTWNEDDRKELSSPRTKAYKEVEFWYFVQFILCDQMKRAHDYARSKGVILKGDIPIGVARYGCDAWSEPRYFNMNGQAGAPPDDFSVNGQNWGFPTYNWDEMLRDGCQWWIRRFQNMANYFDAYRIDHVLGFFRIWEIPTHAVHGLLGQFQPSLGMTREEIEAYGLHWQEELFTEPFITDWVLDRMFRERAAQVRETYLEPSVDGRYKMKEEYNTQRKVEKAFGGKTDEKDIWLRDSLYALISDVLFVRDHKDLNKFHPRISVQFDFIYESLYDSDKYIFNKLYNDYFYRRNNQFWYREAMRKLPLLVNATRMLVCAEDLGMVPDCVPWVMDELKILSLELQSMPKDPTVRFGHLKRNPYRSVCTISSHDMPTLRQWWDEDTARTQDYYGSMLHRGDAAPHPLPGWLARDILSRQLACPSMLCILSIQDWLAIDEKLRLPDADAERINIPANPKHYWRYRMHLNIEDLLQNQDFTANIRELVGQR